MRVITSDSVSFHLLLESLPPPNWASRISDAGIKPPARSLEIKQGIVFFDYLVSHGIKAAQRFTQFQH